MWWVKGKQYLHGSYSWYSDLHENFVSEKVLEWTEEMLVNLMPPTHASGTLMGYPASGPFSAGQFQTFLSTRRSYVYVSRLPD